MISIVLASAFLASGVTAIASEHNTVYGSQLMTEQERIEHRERMRNATSETERQKIRNEHHKRMQKRAKKKGLSLPEEPPKRGQGKGMGKGMGR